MGDGFAEQEEVRDRVALLVPVDLIVERAPDGREPQAGAEDVLIWSYQLPGRRGKCLDGFRGSHGTT